MSYKMYRESELNRWLRAKNRGRILSSYNAWMLRELKELKELNGRNACVLYFLKVELGIHNVDAMLNSAIKVKGLLIKAIYDTKEYGVPNEYMDGIKRDIKSMRARIDYVQRMIIENLRLTKYYPYFVQAGFGILMEFDEKMMGVEEQLSWIKDDYAEWESEHEREVADHMKSIQPELERHDEFLKRRDEKIKAEKAERRAEKAERDREDREILKNRKKNSSAERRINKSFSHLYRDAEKGVWC